ncbi:MAG: FtsX-like permease family protein [Eubacteriales bacterium]
MYITFKSALALMRNKKVQNLLIGIIIFLVSALLYLGVSMVSQNSPFGEMAQRANAAETLIVLQKNKTANQNLIDWYDQREEVEGMLLYQTDIFNCKFGNMSDEESGLMFVTEYNNSGNYDLLYVDEDTQAKPPADGEVLINFNYAKNRDIKIGDTITILANGNEIDMKVSALVVDTQFSTPFLTPSRCFVPQRFFKEHGIENQMEMIAVKYYDIESIDDTKIFEEFTSENEEFVSPIFIGYKDFRATYSIIFSIIAAVLIVVSLVIFVVVAFVIRSTIQNLIRQRYRQIGVQKAIGYTSLQIRNSFLLAYCIIGFASAVLGSIAALPIRNIINKSISYDMQINISSSIDAYMFINIIIVVATLALFTAIASNKATKVKPVQAIKYGRPEQSVGKTSYSIKGKKGPLSFILSAKQALGNRKKTSALVILLVLLTYGGFLITNIGATLATPKHFASNMFGVEIGDFALQMNEDDDIDKIMEEIKNIDGIDDIMFMANYLSESFKALDDSSQAIGGLLADGNIYDYILLKSGRVPKNESEIVISEYVAIDSGKGIGDYITIYSEKKEETYLITGICNSISSGGFSYIKRMDDIDKSLTSSKGYFWGYFSDEKMTVEDVENEIKEIAGQGAEVSQYDSNVANLIMTLESFPLVVDIMLIIFLIVGGIILLNATIMDINNSIKVYGIMKATGFSKAFISRMLVIRSLILTTVGMVIGFTVCMVSMNGIMNGVFKITPFSTISMPVIFDKQGSIFIAILFITVAIISPLAATRKLDKITPKQLISE